MFDRLLNTILTLIILVETEATPESGKSYCRIITCSN